MHSKLLQLYAVIKSECLYYMAGGSAFKAEEVASTNAPKRESMPDELQEYREDAVVAGVESRGQRAVEDEFRKVVVGSNHVGYCQPLLSTS